MTVPVIAIPSIFDEEIHGIDAAMLDDAPDPAVVAKELRARCADLPLVLHQASFDLSGLEPGHTAGGPSRRGQSPDSVEGAAPGPAPIF